MIISTVELGTLTSGLWGLSPSGPLEELKFSVSDEFASS